MAYSWPVPLDDPWNERVAGQNLACAWLNFRAAGAERLVYCRVLEARSLLRHVKDAVPGAVPTVVQLRAPLELIHRRLSAREPEPGWSLTAATELASRMNTSNVADFIVDNGARPPNEVAREILGLLGWPI